MVIQGNMINGKFVDLGGHVYKIIPEDAEILNELDGSGNISSTPNKDNGNGNKATQSTTPPGTPPGPPPSTILPQPPATPAPAPYTPPAYPECVSFEILKAIQTPSMAQVSVRAHCKGQFADAVVHYDFDVYAQAPNMDIIKFKQTALKTAHAEVIEISRKLLCEQK